MAIILTLALLTPILGVNSVVFAGAVEEDSQSNQRGVILDGKFNEISEFNIIHEKLHSQGEYLTLINSDGVLYAYSDWEEFCTKYSLKFDFAIFDTGEQEVEISTPLLRLNPGYAYNWVDIDFGGNCLAVPEGFDDYYLDPPWNDVISSAAYPYSTSEYKAYCLCEDSYYGGDKWILLKGAAEEDFFGEVNFNDLVSSVCWGK